MTQWKATLERGNVYWYGEMCFKNGVPVPVNEDIKEYLSGVKDRVTVEGQLQLFNKFKIESVTEIPQQKPLVESPLTPDDFGLDDLVVSDTSAEPKAGRPRGRKPSVDSPL